VHGEYKVPGGKLVAVDLEVRDGLLADVRLSGDFFLEPDDALGVIDEAVTGLPPEITTGELARAVEDGLRLAEQDGRVAGPVAMVGFDAWAVAVAVRRALGLATTWEDHTFEVLRPGPLPPAMLAALDQVLTEELAEGRRGPTLRFWDWNERAVFIGSFQSLANEVDPAGVRAHDVTVVRRISGGGAMFAEPSSTITYSLAVPQSLVSGLSFADSYAYLDDWVLEALGDMGIKAWYQPLNDIATEVGKIAGAAQKRVVGPDGGPGAVLHHVTMSYDIDADKMLEVLRIGKEKMSDKGTKSAKKRVDPLRRQTGLPRQAVIERMIESFRNRHGLTRGEVTPEELARAEELVRTKFSNDEWTARVP